MKLGEELQARLTQSLDAEIKFYASRGLITQEEKELIASTFSNSTNVATKALPMDLTQRPIQFSQDEFSEEFDESLTTKIEKVVEDVMTKIGIKATYDRSAWNGNASQWKTAEAYCASCLIDTNTGGGPKTKDKCHLPYKKPGSSSININALRAMASGGRGLPALKGVPRSEIVKAANFMIRHWPSAFDKPAPANVYRLAGKTPPSGTKEASVKFFKDKIGQWWMLGLYSNRWMDREHEILSEASHKEYASWVNETGFKPQVTVYHLPKMPEGFWEKVWSKWGDNVKRLNEIVSKVYEKTSLGEVERIVYLNGFSIAVAKIYPERYDAAEKLAAMQDVGMSHGFLAMAESSPEDFSSVKDTVNIIEKYRSFEVTVLLRERAANYGTAPLFVEEKSVTYTDKDREFMAELLPDEVVDGFDTDTKAASEFMDMFLDYKELADPVSEKADKPIDEEEDTEEEDMEKENKKEQETEVQAPPVVEETPSPEVVASPSETVDEAVEKVMKALNLDSLQEVLSTIVTNQKALADEIEALKAEKKQVEQDLKELKKSEDEKIAEKYSPINWAQVGFSATQSKETALPEKVAEQVQQQAPSTQGALVTGDPVLENFLNSIPGFERKS